MVSENTLREGRTADIAETYEKDTQLVDLLLHDTFTLMSKTFLYAVLIVSACGGPADAGSDYTRPKCDNPRVLAKLPAALSEVSGIAISANNPDIFWVHDDDAPAIFAIDSTGTIRATIRVAGIDNRDWEDIAVAPCGSESCIFLGDIGDNTQNSKHRTVYRFSEPALGAASTAVPLEYRFEMPGKSHDTEALAVLPDGRMFLATKGRSGPITVFEFPHPPVENDVVMLEPVRTLSAGLVQLPEMVTGGSGVSDDLLALRTYSGFQFYRVEADTLIALYDSAYSLAALEEPQGEGIAVRKDGAVFLTSEKSMAGAALLSRVQCKLPA